MIEQFNSLAWYWWALAGIGFFGLLLLGPLLFGRMFFPGLTLALFRRFGWMISGLLDRISPGLDLRLLVRAGNRYFRKSFAATPYTKRMLFLPFCLKPSDCPADVDPQVGLCCTGDCPGCEVGKIRAEALALGYSAVYVVPSSRLIRDRGLMPSDKFIKGKIKENGPCAALGVTCAWNMRHRLLARNTVRGGGVVSINNKETGESEKSALQGVLMESRNCRAGKVNWDRVRRCMNISDKPTRSRA